jgi:hypothetical protein
MDVMQFHRTFYLRRNNQAWWTAKREDNGTWKVHFHADFVSSTDWVAEDDADLMAKVAADMARWIEAVQARYEQLASNTL